MQSRFILDSIFFSMLILFAGCSVSNQVQQAATLAKCDFQIRSVENINLAGIYVQNISSLKDLNLIDFGKLMTSIASPVFPLSLQLNLVVRNPNDKPAGLNRIDWILFIDDIQMTSGSLDKIFIISPNNGTTVIPVIINVNLKQVLQGKSADALVNFGLNLSGKGSTPSRFKIKLKPTLMIGNSAITYPGYINVKTDYSSVKYHSKPPNSK